MRTNHRDWIDAAYCLNLDAGGGQTEKGRRLRMTVDAYYGSVETPISALEGADLKRYTLSGTTNGARYFRRNIRLASASPRTL